MNYECKINNSNDNCKINECMYYVEKVIYIYIYIYIILRLFQVLLNGHVTASALIYVVAVCDVS